MTIIKSNERKLRPPVKQKHLKIKGMYLSFAVRKTGIFEWTAEHAVLVELDGDIIGSLILTLSKHSFISSLFIDEIHRNKGIGTELIKLAIEFATTAGVGATVALASLNSAIPFYKKLGFKIDPSQQDFLNPRMVLIL